MCYDVQGSIHSLILVRYFIVKIFYDVMYDSLLGVVCQKKRSKKKFNVLIDNRNEMFLILITQNSVLNDDGNCIMLASIVFEGFRHTYYS